MFILEDLGISTGPDGQRYLKMEHNIANGLVTVDFYLEQYDMVINVNGPPHYTN